jgi:hypothetical protein
VTPSAWAGPLVAAAGLLVFAGAVKAWRPDDTARALRRAALPVSPGLVRGFAGLEAAVGAGAVILGGPFLAGAVAVSYALFAAFVTAALLRGWPLASCGCFGESDSPPTIWHVVVDGAFALASAAAAIAGGPSPLALAARRPGWGATMVGLAMVVGGLAYLVMARLPRLRLESR